MTRTLLAIAVLIVPPSEQAAIIIEVSNASSDRGAVRCALWEREAFLTHLNRAVGRASAKIKEGRAQCLFVAAPGHYAVSAIHDEDDDGKRSRNILGVPRERYGFSNDARAALRPPSFDSASFSHHRSPLTLNVHLHP